MITASEKRLAEPAPHDAYITEWREAGLDRESIVRTRRLFTPEYRDIAKRDGMVVPSGRVSEATLDKALNTVYELLGD